MTSATDGEPGGEAEVRPDDPTAILPSGSTLLSRPGEALEPLTETARAQRRSRTAGLGIRTQVFLAAAGLVVASVGVAVTVGTWRANAVAEQTITEALERVPELFAHYRLTVERQLENRLTSLATEPGTQAIVAGTDAATRWDWTRATAASQRAQTVFLFDRAGQVLARSDRPLEDSIGRSFASVPWVSGVLDDRRAHVAAIREGPVLSQVVAVPIFSGSADAAVLTGVLAASFAFDSTHARALSGLTRGEVAFLVDVSRRGEPPRFEPGAVTPGLDSAATALVAELLESAPVRGRLEDGAPIGPFEVEALGEPRIAIAIPMRTGRGERIGALAVVRSRAEETAAFRDIRDTLVAIGALAFLVTIPVSFAIGRGVARPIEQLAEGAARIRDGELNVELPPEHGGEVGALTKAFREMVEELREKAALERLLDDLRRNPDRNPPPAGAPRDPTTRSLAVGPSEGDLLAGRYMLHSRLGRGGMATVFRAKDRELDEEIAVKILDPEAFSLGPELGEALRQEIRLARRITHPNVVRTHDLGEADGLRFITMEYVPGTTLREVLDRRGTVELAPGIQIAKQLCRGLAAVHEAGIVHRDVKPPNVMVLPNGVVKLMDFGISDATGMGAEGDFVSGTPRYMSPEQGDGLALDARSDLYSVATVLFEMFTGELPFESASTRQLLELRATRPPPHPRELRPELPARLDEIIVACLATRRRDRPASAAELYRMLLDVPV